jgi:flagellar basal-body rod modification protein FlgD
MSAVNGVGSNTSNNSSSSATETLGGISQTDFLQLLLTELQNQNPLDPMSDTDFATQLATLSEVGSLDSLNTNSTDLLQVQQLSSASTLIGQNITYTLTGATNSSSGVASGLSVQSDGTVDLTINGTNVPLSQINSIN